MPFTFKDMDKEEAWSGAGVLPPGRHLCTIEDVKEGESSGGHPQMVLTLAAMAGADAGSTVRDWVVVIPSTLGKVKQILQAAGVEIESGDWEFDPQALRGREVSVLVREEPKRSDPSQTVNVVAGYDMPRGSDMAEEVPSDRDGLGGDGASQSDDDIPF